MISNKKPSDRILEIYESKNLKIDASEPSLEQLEGFLESLVEFMDEIYDSQHTN